MKSRENDPSITERAFSDGRCSIGVRGNRVAPSRKPRTVLPILVECWAYRCRYPHNGLSNAALLGRAETEFDTRGQIKAPVRCGKAAGQERACTDSKVIRATFDGVSNVIDGAGRQTVADVDKITAWDNHQLIDLILGLAHSYQMLGIDADIAELTLLENGLHRGDILRRRACSVKQQHS